MGGLVRGAAWLAMLVVPCVVAAAGAQVPINPPYLSEPPPADVERIDYDQTLIRRLEGNPNTLNPLLRGSDPEHVVLELLYDTPFVFDAQMRWHVNEAIVERFEESADHLRATVVLKHGLKWHDGHPFTAGDIVFSFDQLRDPKVPAAANKAGLNAIVSCEAVGDYEVRFVFKEASPVSRIKIDFPLVARHVFTAAKAEDPTLTRSDAAVRANRRPVGNGPYRFVEWADDERIVLERWEDYPGPKPFFKRIVFRILRDQKTALLALLGGEIDEMRLSPAQFDAQMHNPQFAKVAVGAKADQWVTNYIGWNMDGSNPFFADVRVRRAMSCALDVDQILQSVYRGLYSRSLGIYPAGSWMFNPEVKPPAHGLAEAGDLLDQAGWKIDPQTGWRTKDGVTFAFEMLCPQESSTGRQTLTYYQQSLRSVGVDMKLRLVEYATSRDLRRRREFQACYGAWTHSDDPDSDRGMWHSSAIDGGANLVSYRNRRVDALFDQAARTFNTGERQRCYREIHKLIYDDQPFTFVSVSPSLWALNKNLRGVEFGPRGAFYRHPGPRNWWVKRGAPLRGP